MAPPVPVPELSDLAMVGAGAGVIAYGIVQAGKLAAAKAEAKIGTVAWNLAVRSASVLAGAGVGFYLQRSPWGVVAGACGGVLAATIVTVIKRKIEALAPGAGQP